MQSSSPVFDLKRHITKIRILAKVCLEQWQTTQDMKDNFDRLNASLIELGERLAADKKLDSEMWLHINDGCIDDVYQLVRFLHFTRANVFAERLAKNGLVILETIQANRQYNKQDNASAGLGLANTANRAYFSSLLGNIIYALNRLDEAKKYHKQAYELVDPARRRYSKNALAQYRETVEMIRGVSFPALAKIAAQQGHHNKAMKFAAISRSFCASSQDDEGKYATVVSLAMSIPVIMAIHLNRDECQEAILWLEYAIELAEEKIKLIKKNPSLFILNHKETTIDPQALALEIERITWAIHSFKSQIKTIEHRIAQTNYVAIILGLEASGWAVDMAFRQETNDVVISFKNRDQIDAILRTLSDSKLLFSVTNDNTITVDLLSIDTLRLKKLLDKCLKNLGDQDKEKEKESVARPSSPASDLHDAFYQPVSVDNKKGKLERHKEKEKEKEKEKGKGKEKEVPESTSSHNKPHPKRTMRVVWESKEYNQPTPTYYKVHGRASILTFSKFSDQAFHKVRDHVTIDKFKAVAKGGNVISSENAKGKQGYLFNLSNTHFQKKYGPEYICKLKILGARGAGNHRFLGRKVTTGTLFSQGNQGVEKTPCELIEFDRYKHNGHKRHK